MMRDKRRGISEKLLGHAIWRYAGYEMGNDNVCRILIETIANG